MTLKKLLHKTEIRMTMLALALLPCMSYAQLISPGDIDDRFGTATGANQTIHCMAFEQDGDIVIGGSFTAFIGNFISRLKGNGTRDVFFNQAAASFNGPVFALAIQNDGKIIAGGGFSVFGGFFVNNIIRLNADGTRDASFGASTNGIVRAIKIQPDGKILIGGDFSTVNGFLSKNRITRLNADGTLDQAFNQTGLGGNNSVLTISVLDDGRIFIGGIFNTFNGTTTNGITRLNSDGSLDPTFNTGTGLGVPGGAMTSAVQPDGKIIIGGGFITYNNFSLNNLVRINTDGTRDITFNAGNNLNGVVNSVVVQENQKVIIGGQFNSYGGTARFGVARLHSDGSLDTSFDPGQGARIGTIDVGAVKTIGLHRSLGSPPTPGTALVIAGDFISYDGVARARIARVHFKSGQTISIDPIPEKTYGDSPFRLTATASSGLPVSFVAGLVGLSMLTIDGDTATIIGAGNAVIAANQPGNDDFYPASGFTTVTIRKADLTAIADNKTRPFNTPNPPLTVSYDGFVGSDDASVLDSPAIASTTATETSPPGVYPIDLSLALDDNYEIVALINGTLTITVAQPDVFVINPADSATGVRQTVTVVSKALPGVTAYTIELSPQPDFSSGVLVRSGSRSQRFTELAYGTRYFARVRASLSPLYGKTTSFVTVRAEDFAFVTSPQDSAVDRPVTLNVTSNVVPGATQYTIELNTAPDFTGTAMVKTGGRTQNFSGLSYNTIYYSRVKTEFTENWGATRSFSTIDAARLSFVVSPKDLAVGQNLTLNVSSNVVPGAAQYTIELNTAPDFTGSSIVSTGERTQRFSGLAFSTTYYNRVKTELSEDWGITRSFTTRSPESFSFITSPADGSVNVNYVVNITANTVPNASLYTIEANTLPDFSGTSIIKTGAAKTYAFQLDSDQQYFVRVQTDVAPGSWGPVSSFTTGNPLSLSFITSPKDGGVNVPTTVNVVANNLFGATSYTIELNTSPDFNGISFIKTGTNRTQNFSGLSPATTYYARVATNLTSGNWGVTRSFTTVNPAARTSADGWKGEDGDDIVLSSEVTARVFPNPFFNRAQVIVQSDRQLPLLLTVTDVMGKELFRMTSSTNAIVTIGDDLTPGVYLVRLSVGGIFRTVRVVKS